MLGFAAVIRLRNTLDCARVPSHSPALMVFIISDLSFVWNLVFGFWSLGNGSLPSQE
jgi:hypothetical protein